MALPIRSDEIEVVSGGASDPKMKAGTGDPSSGGGVAAPEGSLYLRYAAAAGEVWFKSSTGNTDWTEVGSGGGGGTLDEAYDGGGSGVGRIITADSGAVQINATTIDTQPGLFIDRAPAGSAAAVGLSVSMSAGGNSSAKAIDISDAGQGNSIVVTKSNSGYAFDAQLTNSGAQAIRIAIAAATTASAISIASTTTGAIGELATLSKIPGAATAGDAMSITMGANASGDALQITHSGSGNAINVSSGDVVIGTVGTPVYASPLEVGSNSNAQITIRNNSATAEVNIGVDGSYGWVGTATNHELLLYANDQTQFKVQASGALRSDRNLQPVETGIFDFSVEPGGAGTNGNYLAGGAGSAAALSAANTGRIRYNESTQEWQKSENGGAYGVLGGEPPPSTFERHASFGVDVGVSTQEASLGRITYSGSVVGLSVHAEDATTAGTLTVNVKVNGVTKITAVLSSGGGDTESSFTTVATGTNPIAQNDEISVEVIGDASYDNTPSGVTGIIVNVTSVDGSAVSNPNVALLDAAQTFTAGQAVAQVVPAGTAIDAALSNSFERMLIANSTLDNPMNVVRGMTINIAIRQDVTGGWTLGYGTAYKFPGGAPTITAAAFAEDIISCYVRDVAGGVATVMLCSIAQDHT